VENRRRETGGEDFESGINLKRRLWLDKSFGQEQSRGHE
jgi:hypothetical protein